MAVEKGRKLVVDGVGADGVQRIRKNARGTSGSSGNRSYVSGRLYAFFIIDPIRRLKDAENGEGGDLDEKEEKLLYYHPSFKVAEEKQKHANLIEGLILFTRKFSGDSNPLNAIHTKQYVLVVHEAEENLWVTLVFRKAHHITLSSTCSPLIEWDEEEIHDSFLAAILRNMCAIFKLLHGSLHDFIKNRQLQMLRDLLDDFVPAYFETIDGDKISLVNELEGFHYAPVIHETILSVHSFINSLKARFRGLQHAVLLFDGYLVYCGLTQADMLILYSYLVCYNGRVDSMKLNYMSFGRAPTAASEPGGGFSPFGRANVLNESGGYLFGSSNSTLFVPTVHFSNNTEGKLTALLYRRIMLIMIFESSEITENLLSTLREVATTIPGGLKDLQPKISDQVAATLSREDVYRFLYFNNANKAFRISNQKAAATASSKEKPYISENEIKLLGDIYQVLQKTEESSKAAMDDVSEIAVKLPQNGWLQAKFSLGRQIFLLLDNPKAAFSDAEEESANFVDMHFKNICI